MFIPLTIALINPFQGPAETHMDFWVGNWKFSGRARKTATEWTEISGKNSIKKVQGGKVVLETFDGAGFTGQSWSVFDANDKVWKQTWVDNSGGYLLFEGGKVGDKFILSQVNIPKNKPKLSMRMVFQSITPKSFEWLWQSSTDSGKTWSSVYEIKYTK
ncbi:MAG: DUF1579 family protein [Fimbriimonadaceae bacterium]